MYDKLDDNFKKIVDDQREEFNKLSRNPPRIFCNVWIGFWELRNTKSMDHPINHTDIKNYTDLIKYKINTWEVRQILQWDNEYYHYYNKHKEN